MTRVAGELGGTYDLGEPLAGGGQGVVHAATDALDGRAVVVKVALAPGDRACREAALRLAALGEDPVAGPHLVPVVDVGTWEDRPFVVLERQEATLGEALASGVDPEDAAWAVLTAAEALERAGVVHGDLKPSNVFLQAGEGRAAALFADPWGGGPDAVLTPGFAAPELWRGGLPSAEADRYALGATLVAVFTGHPPACAAGAEARAPAPEELAALPGGWRRRVGALLDPDPAERPRVAEVARGWRRGGRSVGRWVWGAVAVGVAGVTAAAIRLSEPPSPPPACPPPFAREAGGCRAPDGRRVVWAPPGAFVAGAGAGDSRWAPDAPPTPIELRSGVWVRTTEVTQREAAALLGANPAEVGTEWFPELRAALPCTTWWGQDLVADDLPAMCLSWYDAIALANAASRADGLPPAYRVVPRSDGVPTVTWDRAATGWRLPTEAEWEWLARGGDAADRWAGAPSRDTICGHANFRDRSAHEFWGGEVACSDGAPVLARAGSSAPNALGVHDALGNVAEWVWDRYGDREGSPLVDPPGPAVGGLRVFRGGGWNHVARPPSARYAAEPGFRGMEIGVRLVRGP